MAFGPCPQCGNVHYDSGQVGCGCSGRKAAHVVAPAEQDQGAVGCGCSRRTAAPVVAPVEQDVGVAVAGQVGANTPTSVSSIQVTLWESMVGEHPVVVITLYGKSPTNSCPAWIASPYGDDMNIAQMLAAASTGMSMTGDAIPKTVAAIKARWNTPADLYLDFSHESPPAGGPLPLMKHWVRMSPFVEWLNKRLAAPVSLSRGFTVR